MGTADDARITEYINEVCQQIKFREMHQEVKLELNAHLHEVADEYTAGGFSEKEAVDRAIAQMGSSAIVGKQLNRVHKSKPEWSIVTLSLLFVGLGLLALYFIERQALSATPVHLFTRSVVFTIIGAAIAAGLYLCDYRKLMPYSRHIYTGTLLMLVAVIIFGQSVNGKNYLSIGPFSFDIVGISPLLLGMALAGILSGWDWNKPQKLLQGLLLCVVPLALMWASGPLSASAVYAAACTVIVIASGAGRRITLLLVGSLFSVLIMMTIAGIPYMFQRLTGFISPENDPLGSGWLSIQLGELIGGSGMFGQGLAQQPKLIPYLHTDFIFSYITFSFGWIAGGILAALAVMFIIRLAGVAKTVKNTYARLLISGFVAIFAVQFLWNILMNIGLAPIAGIGLPLISYGGSQLIFNAAALGLVFSIYRRRNISITLLTAK
ncbi:MAG: cell division protein [Peptococcaceae bacterium BICA1-7]|nr:MAG: cell division protein [Peptococcaceae bacterium BICA1-7]HBV99364.1 FtsW/RodA/SpoVE family cell cycle protein [Desulfotomaculum sp.]